MSGRTRGEGRRRGQYRGEGKREQREIENSGWERLGLGGKGDDKGREGSRAISPLAI